MKLSQQHNKHVAKRANIITSGVYRKLRIHHLAIKAWEKLESGEFS